MAFPPAKAPPAAPPAEEEEDPEASESESESESTSNAEASKMKGSKMNPLRRWAAEGGTDPAEGGDY